MLPSPSSVYNYPNTTLPTHFLVSPTHEFHSPTNTPTEQTLKSPASKSYTLRSGATTPCINSSGFKTPSPSSGQICPWLLADCNRTPVNIASPTTHSLKFKSPKAELGDCTDSASKEEQTVLLGRPVYKRIGAPLTYPNSSTYAKCMKLFNSSKEASSNPTSLPRLVEVVDVSDDDDQGPKDQDTQTRRVGDMDTDVHDLELRRLMALLENATHNLFTDMESFVRSIGQMMEATIGICNHLTRGA